MFRPSCPTSLASDLHDIADGLRRLAPSHRDPERYFEGKSELVAAAAAGAWEAALVNTLSPGDQVLMYETGHFAALWTIGPGETPVAIAIADCQ